MSNFAQAEGKVGLKRCTTHGALVNMHKAVVAKAYMPAWQQHDVLGVNKAHGALGVHRSVTAAAGQWLPKHLLHTQAHANNIHKLQISKVRAQT